MKLKRTLKTIRLALFGLILLSFFIIPIYTLNEEVKFSYTKEIMDIQTEHDFSIEVSKPVRTIDITITYFNDENTAVFEDVVSFETQGESIIETSARGDIPNATRFQISQITVFTIDDENVEIVGAILTDLFVLLLLLSSRVKVVVNKEEGHEIVVYSGFMNHKVFVDGKVVAMQNKIFFVNPLILRAEIDKEHFALVEIFALKTIKVSMHVVNIVVEEDFTQTSDETENKILKHEEQDEIISQVEPENPIIEKIKRKNSSKKMQK